MENRVAGEDGTDPGQDYCAEIAGGGGVKETAVQFLHPETTEDLLPAEGKKNTGLTDAGRVESE